MRPIFVSYRWGSDGPSVKILVAALRHAFGGSSVFHDTTSQPRSGRLKALLIDEVRRCRVFVVAIGVGWQHERLADADDYVAIELRAALSRGDVSIIPVLLDGARPPEKDALPADLRPLLDYLFFAIDSHKSEPATSRRKGLLRFLGRDAWVPGGFGSLAAAVEGALTHEQGPPSWRRWGLALAAALGVLVISVASSGSTGTNVISCGPSTVVTGSRIHVERTQVNAVGGRPGRGVEP